MGDSFCIWETPGLSGRVGISTKLTSGPCDDSAADHVHRRMAENKRYLFRFC